MKRDWLGIKLCKVWERSSCLPASIARLETGIEEEHPQTPKFHIQFAGMREILSKICYFCGFGMLAVPSSVG
ncbi:MAG: hypothetical protein QXH24_04975 [Candidatus Bathyarchaeia archaeon]